MRDKEFKILQKYDKTVIDALDKKIRNERYAVLREIYAVMFAFSDKIPMMEYDELENIIGEYPEHVQTYLREKSSQLESLEEEINTLILLYHALA